jgi:hypothetical protein
LIKCPSHEKVKNGEWENECTGDLKTKDEFGKKIGKKIVRNIAKDSKKLKKEFSFFLLVC